MKGNYNNIAPYYDRLSRVIFGKAIVNVQRYLVDFIKANSTILIVGGGTGWILEEITKKHPEGLHITYIEISEKMVELSRERDFGKNEVIFINKPIQEAVLSRQFNFVITPFFLDNFSDETTRNIFKKIHHVVTGDGLWLFADFRVTEKNQLWQMPLLKIMYIFFRTVCNIEAHRLPDTDTLFKQYSYKKIASKAFFHDFICADVFIKQDHR